MNILLINPPNCGRSIPEEAYGITSIKQIFRGEPLALEMLAGNLDPYAVHILDMKVEPHGLESTLTAFRPDLVGITAMTCEAKTVLHIAAQIQATQKTIIVVGGSHASNDPDFFNQANIDFIVCGPGRISFRALADALAVGDSQPTIAGVIKTAPDTKLPPHQPRTLTFAELVADKPPHYDLVKHYRPHYKLESLGIQVGFVATALGCPFHCAFCCIASSAKGRYVTHSPEAIVRDMEHLPEIPVIRLVDANSFAAPKRALQLCKAIEAAGLQKQFIADVRSDTVVRHPELIKAWKEVGLRAVVVGFEEIDDLRLNTMVKSNTAANNLRAIEILHNLGITIVGDFIISLDYDEQNFWTLERYITQNRIDLPIPTILTPLPGTPLHTKMREQIILHDLDYYTLTNAVAATRMETKSFYQAYAHLLTMSHATPTL